MDDLLMEDITKRIDAVTNIDNVRLQMGGVQYAPKSVKIEITSRCNLRCKFCALRTRDAKGRDMDFYFFQKITEDMRICGVEEIGLFYLGESFMNKSLLIDCLQWVKQELGFPYVFLTSNAVEADTPTVSKLMMLGLDSLKWSVNCADEGQFQDITMGGVKSFESALRNIKDAWEQRERLQAKTMLSASSILYEGEQHQRMSNLIQEKVKPYVDRHYWLPLYQMSMYRDKIIQEMGYVPTAGNMGRIDDDTLQPTRKPLPCWSAFTEGHVRVDGGLSACCFGADDRFDMALLDGTNFMRAWNSRKFQHLRKAQLRTLSGGQSALNGTPCEVCVGYSEPQESHGED